ncbi:nucleotide exchange factor GrpE [Brumimicrobium salinarum]|uniref:Protein GrpE n=1 Tax=Brumimicrobium salinarum TaxID=2058658 RepID=A0A2I0R414_9FLAO|nr:nucleotide exchange factor GrpE [Brumimicrobium salinarum]PKR81316.1 nucleotide exchange factor GrpE [Brumimicrobium salinarum]
MKKKDKEKKDKEKAVDQEENQTAEETQNTDDQAEQENADSNENAESDKKELSKEEELEIKLAELNDKYLRLYSDFENFRKRTIREKGDLIANASEGVVKDMLPIMDDFERAIENNQTSDDPESIKQGFQLIYNKLDNTLKSKGLKAMDSKGETFDIDHHEAITNIPADKKQKGKVVDVVEKGYFLNDKVLRYAKVVVGQ